MHGLQRQTRMMFRIVLCKLCVHNLEQYPQSLRTGGWTLILNLCDRTKW